MGSCVVTFAHDEVILSEPGDEDDVSGRLTKPWPHASNSSGVSLRVLANGLDFIADALDQLIAVPTAEPPEVQRLCKYALLHLSSGVELVLKARLLHDHWTYVFSDMNRADETKLASGDFVSVGADKLIDRLSTLCGIEIAVEAVAAFKAIRSMRNRAEHFVMSENVHAIESAVKRGLPPVIDFVVEYCGEAAAVAPVMGLLDRIKPGVTQITESFDQTARIAQAQAHSFESLGGTVLRCPECLAAPTLLIDGDSRCVLCDYRAEGPSASALYVETVLGISAYEAVTSGGDFPVHNCPECQSESLVIGDEDGKAICFTCGFKAEDSCFADCSSCGQMYLRGVDELPACVPCLESAWVRFD